MEYQIVPLEIKNEVADFTELAEQTRRIREESSRKASPEDRLKEIEKIDQLLEELGEVRRELKFQRMRMLGLIEPESDFNYSTNRRTFIEWMGGILAVFMLPALSALLAIMTTDLRETVVLSLVGGGLLIIGFIIFVNWYESNIETPGIKLFMKNRLVKKTHQYRALKEAIASLKQLTASLKLAKIKLYI